MSFAAGRLALSLNRTTTRTTTISFSKHWTSIGLRSLSSLSSSKSLTSSSSSSSSSSSLTSFTRGNGLVSLNFVARSNHTDTKKDDEASKDRIHERMKLTRMMREMSHRGSTTPDDFLILFHKERDIMSSISSVALYLFLAKTTAQHHVPEFADQGLYSDLINKIYDEIPFMNQRTLASLALGVGIMKTKNERLVNALWKKVEEKAAKGEFKYESISQICRSLEMTQMSNSPILALLDKSLVDNVKLDQEKLDERLKDTTNPLRNPVITKMTPNQLYYIVRSMGSLGYKSDSLWQTLEKVFVDKMHLLEERKIEQIVWYFAKLGYDVNNIKQHVKKRQVEFGLVFENLKL